MALYGYKSDVPPRFEVYRYSIKSTAKKLGFNFGYKILYRILRKLNILDQYNNPNEKYVEAGLLVEEYNKLRNGENYPQIYVVGQEGLNFIKKEVDNFLSNNDIKSLKQKRKKKIKRNYDDDESDDHELLGRWNELFP